MIYKFKELDSTNTYCLDNYKDYNHLDIITCLNQTNGRGRLGRNWECNDSIAMSIILKKNLNFDVSIVSFIAASSVYNVMKKYTKNVSIKWPNDILIDGLKVCGILSQSRYENNNLETLVVGIGINTNNKVFSNELINKATSLYLLNNILYDNDLIIEQVQDEFINLLNRYLCQDSLFLSIIKENNFLLNKEIEFVYDNKDLTGVVVGIDDECRLIVNTVNSTLYLSTGEVILKNAYK